MAVRKNWYLILKKRRIIKREDGPLFQPSTPYRYHNNINMLCTCTHVVLPPDCWSDSFNPLNPNLKLISISACLSQIFSPHLRTSTSYHSRTMQQCCLTRENRNGRLRPSTTPTWLQARIFDLFSKSGLNLPLLWGKRKEPIHLQVSAWNRHQGSWGLRTCCVQGAATQPPCLHFVEAHHPLPLPYFWLCQKNLS